MPFISKDCAPALLSPDELIRQKLLCDVMFGACGEEEYEQTTGGTIGEFSLCVIGQAGGKGQRSSAAEIVVALKSIPFCKDATIFAVAPWRVAVYADRSWQIGTAPGCEELRASLADRLCGSMDAEAAEGFGAEELNISYLHCDNKLCERMRRASGPREEQPVLAVAGKSVKPVLSKALDYIEKHFTEQIALQDVSEHAFASPFYISRLFKKELGISFVDYLGALRVDNARRLLRETQMRIFEVSERVGIQDAHYFAKLFKKHAGISPTEYRAENKS